MAKKIVTKIKVCGSALSYYVNGFKRTRSKPKKPFKDLPEEEKNRRKGERRRHQKIKMLYSILLRSKPFPYWFITLIYDRDIATMLSAEAIREDISTLGARIRYHFPDGWFFYSVEWSPKSGPHIHLLGAVSRSESDMNKLFTTWWSKIIGSDEEKMVDVKCLRTPKQVRTRRGYLHKGSKRNREKNIAKLFGKKNSFGIFNKANCPIDEPEKFTLDYDDDSLYRGLIIADMITDSICLTPRTKAHLIHVVTGYSGFHVMKDRKLVKKFLRLMKIKHGGKK